MANKIDEINIRLAAILNDGWALNKEQLFNLGVELGRELNSQNIDKFRLKVWSDIEKENLHEKEIRDAVKKIKDFIALLLRLSILEHIEEIGSWSIEKGGGYGLSLFSDEIVKKYNIQVLSCDMESYGGEFIVNFKVTDELEKIFKKNNIYTKFDARIYNDDGEEEQTLYDVKRLSDYIYGINAHIRNNNDWKLEKYNEFLQEISKPFLFLIIKHSGKF
jgi:hypothetical protein